MACSRIPFRMKSDSDNPILCFSEFIFPVCTSSAKTQLKVANLYYDFIFICSLCRASLLQLCYLDMPQIPHKVHSSCLHTAGQIRLLLAIMVLALMPSSVPSSRNQASVQAQTVHTEDCGRETLTLERRTLQFAACARWCVSEIQGVKQDVALPHKGKQSSRQGITGGQGMRLGANSLARTKRESENDNLAPQASELRTQVITRTMMKSEVCARRCLMGIEIHRGITSLVLRGGVGKRMPQSHAGKNSQKSKADLASAVAAIINSPIAKIKHSTDSEMMHESNYSALGRGETQEPEVQTYAEDTEEGEGFGAPSSREEIKEAGVRGVVRASPGRGGRGGGRGVRSTGAGGGRVRFCSIFFRFFQKMHLLKACHKMT